MMTNDRDAMDFDTGIAVLSRRMTARSLGIGVDVYGGQTSGTGNFDAKFPYGTFGRPRDPTSSNDGTAPRGYGSLGLQRQAAPCMAARTILEFGQSSPKAPRARGAYADTGNDDIPVMVLDGTTARFALRVPHLRCGRGSPRARGRLECRIGGNPLANGNGCELVVKSTEVVSGQTLAALASQKASSVEGIVTALQTMATSFAGLTPLAPATGDRYRVDGALRHCRPFRPKFRSE